jgi:hypothetical protein
MQSFFFLIVVLDKRFLTKMSMLHKKEYQHFLIRYYKSIDYVSYLASATKKRLLVIYKTFDKNNQPIFFSH